MSPTIIELSAVARSFDGVGCKPAPFLYRATVTSFSLFDADGHVYGLFNISYGVGNARK